MAELAIRYADASHERRVKELNEVEIGVDRVATMVVSGSYCQHISFKKHL